VKSQCGRAWRHGFSRPTILTPSASAADALEFILEHSLVAVFKPPAVAYRADDLKYQISLVRVGVFVTWSNPSGHLLL